MQKLVLKKDFYSLKWEKSDRVQNFLEPLGLSSRLIEKNAVIEDVISVDYKGVDDKMLQNRQLSEDFLDKALIL